MRVIRGVACLVILVSVLALEPVPALAQQPSRTLHTFGGSVWFASATATEPAGTGTWRTTLLTFDYRASFQRSPWGLRLRYATGGQGGWGGTFAGASAGTDNMWSVDASYQVDQPGTRFWVLAGFGSISFESTLPAGLRRVTSSGLRVGVSLEIPLMTARVPGLSINSSFIWSPANRMSSLSGGTTTVTTGSATEWSIALHYEFRSARATAGDGLQAGNLAASFTTLEQHDPGFEAMLGYKGIGISGSSFNWSGPFLGVKVTY